MVLKQKNEKIFSPKFPTYLVNLTKFINNDDYLALLKVDQIFF